MHDGPKGSGRNFSSVDNQDGTYNLLCKVEIASRYTITVSSGDKEIRGSPLRLVVNAKKAVSAANTTAERGVLDAGASSVYNRQASFAIIPHDAYGNLLGSSASNCNFRVVMVGSGKTLASVGPANRKADGSYNVSYTEQSRTAYQVNVLMVSSSGTTTAIKQSPYTIAVESKTGAYAPSCTVDAFQASIVAGSPTQLTAKVKDHYGDDYTGSTAVEILLDGVLKRDLDEVAIKYEYAAKQKASNSNEWTSNIQAQIAGTYNVSVKVKSSDGAMGLAGNKVHTLAVKAGAMSAPHCTMSTSGSVITEAGKANVIVVTARDEYGNRLTTGGAKFTLAVHDGPQKGNIRFQSVDQKNGTYNLLCKVEIASRYTITVSSGGKEIRGSPLRLVVNALDTVSAAKTTAERGVLAAGASSVYESASTFNIVPRDKYGNLLDKSSAGATFSVRLAVVVCLVVAGQTFGMRCDGQRGSRRW